MIEDWTQRKEKIRTRKGVDLAAEKIVAEVNRVRYLSFGDLEDMTNDEYERMFQAFHKACNTFWTNVNAIRSVGQNL